jgi:hypothetical protein
MLHLVHALVLLLLHLHLLVPCLLLKELVLLLLQLLLQLLLLDLKQTIAERMDLFWRTREVPRRYRRGGLVDAPPVHQCSRGLFRCKVSWRRRQSRRRSNKFVFRTRETFSWWLLLTFRIVLGNRLALALVACTDHLLDFISVHHFFSARLRVAEIEHPWKFFNAVVVAVCLGTQIRPRPARFTRPEGAS